MFKKVVVVLVLLLIILGVSANGVYAESVQINIPDIGLNFGGEEGTGEGLNGINLMILLTVLTLVPSFLILVTSFTRIIVVLSFLRNAMGTQQTPPNQILIGLALFLTLFIMAPVYGEVMDTAGTPFLTGQITQEEAIDRGVKPIKEFMLNQTRENDLALFIDLSDKEISKDRMETPIVALVPAFVISELKTAFQIGFMLFLPFIVIDLIVASILMSMGMVMLPPVMISLPFKILLFVMIDGWYLVVKSLIESFMVGG